MALPTECPYPLESLLDHEWLPTSTPQGPAPEG
jgi:hypothetical protein